MLIRKTLMVFGILYFIGGAFTFGVQTMLPVPLELAAFRSFVWPLWITTGLQKGTSIDKNDCDSPRNCD